MSLLASGTQNIAWWIVAGAAVVVVIATLWVLWWWLPKWLATRLRFQIRDAKDRADVEDNYRKAIVQPIAGVAVLAGAWLAYYGTQQTIEASRKQARDQLISQQVSRGFELLGRTNTSTDKSGDKTVIRLGGIYALEGVMNTSEQYHEPVLEALCAFVRDGTKDVKGQGPPATDIQAALTVIGRREPGKGRVNLTGAHIPKADLSDANLHGADLSGADMPRANLFYADLSGADLSWAPGLDAITNLSGAGLYDADLSGANLSGADLSGAYLLDANLSGADLSYADLSDANLLGADLSHAVVGQNQLAMACGDSSTKLPSGMTIKKCPSR